MKQVTIVTEKKTYKLGGEFFDEYGSPLEPGDTFRAFDDNTEILMIQLVEDGKIVWRDTGKLIESVNTKGETVIETRSEENDRLNRENNDEIMREEEIRWNSLTPEEQEGEMRVERQWKISNKVKDNMLAYLQKHFEKAPAFEVMIGGFMALAEVWGKADKCDVDDLSHELEAVFRQYLKQDKEWQDKEWAANLKMDNDYFN